VELYQAEHDGLGDKLSDMGVGLVCATVLYAIASTVFLARSAELLVGTDVGDLLTSWSGLLVGIVGLALAAVAIGLWCRSRWTRPLAMAIHGAIAFVGLLGFRSSMRPTAGTSEEFLTSLWLSVGLIFVSVFCMWWWNRDEPRAWTRVREDAG
jgi:hypothetical protein